MAANQSKDWRTLCEAASKEKDPQKLMELVTELNKALEERYNRRNSIIPDEEGGTHSSSAPAGAW